MPTGNYGKYRKRRLNAKEIFIMATYFRITAYHPEKDMSVIMDSNGIYEKLWQFSAYLVSKGFKVLEVGSEGSFTDGNIERAEYDAERMILRACQKGKPTYRDGTVIVEGKYYKPISN